MKYFFLIISILFLNLSSDLDKVYICVSKTATKYHKSPRCKGLVECTHEIRKVSLKEAQQRGYKTLCGWEK